MARTKKQFSVVTIQDGQICVDTMGEEELRAWLVESDRPQDFSVFVGEEIKVRVETRTEVVIGERRTRKAKGEKPAAKSKKNGQPVDAAFFEKNEKNNSKENHQ